MNDQFVVGPTGGGIAFVTADGEVRQAIEVPPGVYPRASFEKMRWPGETVLFSGVVVRACGNMLNVQHPAAFESAANPAFRPSTNGSQLRLMQQMMVRTEVLARRADKALQAARRGNRGSVPKIADMTAPVENGGGEVSAT